MDYNTKLIIVLLFILVIGAGLLLKQQDFFSGINAPGYVNTGDLPVQIDSSSVEVYNNPGSSGNGQGMNYNNTANCMVGILRQGIIVYNNTVEYYEFPEGGKDLCCNQEITNNVFGNKTCVFLNNNMEATHMVYYEYEDGEVMSTTMIYVNNQGKYCQKSGEMTSFVCED